MCNDFARRYLKCGTAGLLTDSPSLCDCSVLGCWCPWTAPPSTFSLGTANGRCWQEIRRWHRGPWTFSLLFQCCMSWQLPHLSMTAGPPPLFQQWQLPPLFPHPNSPMQSSRFPVLLVSEYLNIHYLLQAVYSYSFHEVLLVWTFDLSSISYNDQANDLLVSQDMLI